MTRIAAVDCGTNSIRLLICEVRGDSVTEIHRTMEIVRLGRMVDETGKLDPAAIERTRVALEGFVQIMKFEEVKAVRMVATSATRDASNRDEFFAMTAELLGQITPGAQAEVISGDEEADLSFLGAITDLDPAQGPFCVIDLGGGSTEFIVGSSEGEVMGAHSTQMGCVRLTERIMRADPPTETEVEIARSYIQDRLVDVVKTVPINKAKTVVGVAGTFTTLSALAQGLEKYDPVEIHSSVLRFSALRVLTREIRKQSSEARTLNPVVHPGRADVLGSGCVIVEEIMGMLEENSSAKSFVISEKDILDGIITSLAESLNL
ncbi:Ppx/GppA phosphatase family protein [Corynebacterium alimapuense]|uniref:Exopolyphosphatase n=1 Tax=Corynebacterium alimapuense TaxID=1576874 RepID=A0A3M8K7J7_9CORY|nr:Ppx/GppA phosphatase family protein [Corynebacterium alimapuense]RNE48542.1 exopolyphosphatase [Corynebacterium alimapuense]